MAVPTPDNAVDSFRTRWAAVSALNTLIPSARVFAKRVAEGTAWPAAAIKVEDDFQELTSNKVIKSYRVTIEATTTNAAGVRAALDEAFMPKTSDPKSGLTITNGTVVHTKPLPGGTSDPTGERLDGSDLVRVVAAFKLVVEGTR